MNQSSIESNYHESIESNRIESINQHQSNIIIIIIASSIANLSPICLSNLFRFSILLRRRLQTTNSTITFVFTKFKHQPCQLCPIPTTWNVLVATIHGRRQQASFLHSSVKNAMKIPLKQVQDYHDPTLTSTVSLFIDYNIEQKIWEQGDGSSGGWAFVRPFSDLLPP